jgi:hypothetical protein
VRNTKAVRLRRVDRITSGRQFRFMLSLHRTFSTRASPKTPRQGVPGQLKV